jgi:hypothetical protein
MSEKKKDEGPVKKHILDNIEKEKLRVKIIEETTNDLKTNAKYKRYFEKYHPISVGSFITRYASRKADFIIHGPMYKKMYFDKLNKFTEEAKKLFVMIQQEKLLQLQYRWNAEEIKIDGIESNYDFYPIYDDIYNCKLISPVIREEVDLFYGFVNSYEGEFHMSGYYAQNLVTFRVGWDEEGDLEAQGNVMPPYHLYRNNALGIKPLLKASLIRAVKEGCYTRAYHKEQQRLRGPQIPKAPTDTRPRLSIWNGEQKREFIAKYETQTLLNYYDAMMRDRGDEDMEDHVNLAMWHLDETNKRIPIAANADWRKALMKIANEDKRKKTAEALYVVYEEYMECLKNNVPFPQPEEGYADNGAYKKMKEMVLQGRELLGEPRDFNF